METQFFKEIPFFSHLNDEQITQLAQAFQPRKFKKDDVIIQKGDKPDGMYVIVFGTVEVKLDDKHIKQLKGNQFFGEIALITSEPRTATVKANSEDLLTLYLSKEIFDDIKKELNEDIKKEILKRIVENYEGW